MFCFLIITIVLLQIKAHWASTDNGCRTPTRGVGNCIPIHDCNSIMNYLQSMSSSSTAISNNIVELLRNYQCDLAGDSVRVCCPKETFLANPVTTRSSINEDPPAPEVKNHRNLHLLPYNCGLSDIAERVSGGNETLTTEFPWMVLISYSTKSGSSYKCGGTIINNRYILTAAHCVSNLADLKIAGVRIGEHNISSFLDCDVYSDGDTYCAPPVQDIKVEEILPHPDFNPTEFKNDIALLRLAAPINTSAANAKPICLPSTALVRNLNFTGTKLTVTGWGLTESGRRSDSLLKVNIPILARSECQTAYQRSTAKISYPHLCGGGKDIHDSCSGDSGGPLQRADSFNADARVLQYGIISFGAKTCGRMAGPGVYTRVDYYMDWILDTIRP